MTATTDAALASVETAIHDALNAVENVADPVAREAAARRLADVVLPDAARGAKRLRQSAVLELRQGRTLKQVAELLGLSVGRVDQLAKGR